jgi:restriction endonuclease S subunit
MVVMQLKMIGKLRTGLVLSRKKIQNLSTATKKYNLLTLKSFNTDGYIDSEYLEVFYSGVDLDKNYFTKPGDIVVRLSEPNTCVCIDENFANYLVSSSFVIFQLNTTKFLPEYLAWYLNSKFGKKQIARSQTGSAISVINTNCLENIIINETDIDRQKKIIEINKLFIKEKLLLKKFTDKKEIYYKNLLNKLCENKFNSKGVY